MNIPLESKIQLTQYNDTLIVPRNKGDGNELPESLDEIGAHEVCDGFIGLVPSSHTHNVLLCFVCHLRIPVPNTVATYGQLRAFFQEQLKAPP